METTFSIIIPHKNSTDLLERLLNSIPTRNDIQIIVVDDNSDHSKVDFDNLPGKDRPEIEYIFLTKEQSNGAGRARNVGLEHAKGKWLLFADADDFYTENLSYILDKYANDNATDIVYLNARTYYADGTIEGLPCNRYIRNYLNKKSYSEMVLRYNVWTPWTRMVKRELVEKYNIQYEEVPLANDTVFCLLCSKYSKVIAAEEAIIYNYYKPAQGSLTEIKAVKPETYKFRLDVIKKVNNIYNEVGYKYKLSYMYFIINLYRRKKLHLYKDIVQRCRKEYDYPSFKDTIAAFRLIYAKFFKII